MLIKLCNSTDAVVLAKAQQEPQATVCDLCKLVVNFIKPFVDSNSTEVGWEVVGGMGIGNEIPWNKPPPPAKNKFDNGPPPQNYC